MPKPRLKEVTNEPEVDLAIAQLEALIAQPLVQALIDKYTLLVVTHAAVSANPMKDVLDAQRLGTNIKALLATLKAD